MSQTMGQVLSYVRGLRGQLSSAEYNSWLGRLEGNFYPETVHRAAEAVANAWTQSSPWPIGVLLAKCREIQRPIDEQSETPPMFVWNVDGSFSGDIRIMLKRPQEERDDIAKAILAHHPPGAEPTDAQAKLAAMIRGER